MTKVKEKKYISSSPQNSHPNWKTTVSNVTVSLCYRLCDKTFKNGMV